MRLSAGQIEAIKQETENFFGIGAPVWLFGSRVVDKQRGFTLVELIMTMVIVGIIGAVVAPRFFDNNVFQSRGFADEVQASLRYAQKVAVAQRRVVCMTFDTVSVPNTLALTIDTATPPDGGCDAPLPALAAGANYVIRAPAGVAFGAAANFNFNALGTPAPAPTTITITDVTNGITIEPETGYVHSP